MAFESDSIPIAIRLVSHNSKKIYLKKEKNEKKRSMFKYMWRPLSDSDQSVRIKLRFANEIR